jgi:hypothetical protein
MAASPAGVALLADVEQHLRKLDVRSRFPVRLRKTALLVPLGAALLAAVALFYPEDLFQASAATVQGRTKDSKEMPNPKDVKAAMDAMRQPPLFKLPKDHEMSKELKDLLQAVDALNKKLDGLDPNNKEQARELLKDIVDMRQKIEEVKEELKAQAEQNKRLKEELKELAPPDPKNAPEDPAKGVDDAARQGDLDKLRQELDKLAEKLNDGKLNEDQRQKLQEEMKDLKDRLNDVAEQKKEKDRLQEEKEKGKIDEKELQRRLDELKEQARDRKELQDVKDLAQKLEQAQKNLKDGDDKKAAEQLAEAAKQLGKMDPKNNELKQVQEQDRRLENLEKALRDGLQGNPPPQGQGDQDPKADADPQGKGKGEKPGGRRPIGADKDVTAKDEKQKVEVDPKSGLRISGEKRGGTYQRPPTKAEVPDVVNRVLEARKQADSEAQDRSRVPTEATEMLRGYFENLGSRAKKK